MRYDISKRKALEILTSERVQNASNCCSKRPQKTYMNP